MMTRQYSLSWSPTIAVLQIFSEPYIMTQGGPANSTLTIVYYLYQKGFQRFQMGYGASLAWIVFAIIFIITTLQFRLANRGYRGVTAMSDRLTVCPFLKNHLLHHPSGDRRRHYPFIFMVTTSLKDSPEVFADIMKPFGKRSGLNNYKVVLSTVNMGRYMLNTCCGRGGLDRSSPP